ncbi:hypothetical protein ACFL3V_04320 [Nanoarchaeota archaeon]
MVVIEIPKDEKKEELLDSLVEHLEEIKEEAAEARRQGMDTAMADLLVHDFMPKVKLARVTYDKRDIAALKKQLSQIRHELDISKQGTEFDSALMRIQTAYDKIREEDYGEARKIYNGLRNVYVGLSGEMRRTIYKASLDLHRKLRKE